MIYGRLSRRRAIADVLFTLFLAPHTRQSTAYVNVDMLPASILLVAPILFFFLLHSNVYEKSSDIYLKVYIAHIVNRLR